MKILNWALWVWESDKDFLIWNTDELPKLEIQDNERYEYNQWNSLDCTLYSSFWALSDLMNYRFNTEEISDIVNMSYLRWRKRNKWWQTALWVKCVCDYWNNKFPYKPVAYYRLQLLSDTVVESLEKWYTIIVTYKGNSNYNADYIADLSLDKDSFWTPTYWHATTMITKNNIIKDSYAWSKNSKWQDINKYVIKASLENLVKNGVFYSNCYLIVKLSSEDRLEELKRLK